MKRTPYTPSFARLVNVDQQAVRDYTISLLYAYGVGYGWSPKEIIRRLERLTPDSESIADVYF